MSQSQNTYQTITTINVSQGHETPALSSPPPQQAPAAGDRRADTLLVQDSLDTNAPAVDEEAEIVEDSLTNRTAATTAVTNMNGPTNRPSQQAQAMSQPDEDDLYSVTPDRARTEIVRGSPKATAESQRKVANNALDALLTKGATVHKTAQKPQRIGPPPPIIEDDEDELQQSQGERSAPTGAQAPKSAAKAKRSLGEGRAQKDSEDDDELQSFDDGMSAPIGSHPQSSRKKIKAPAASKTSAATRPPKATMTSRAAPTSATGALAALRQRRGQGAASSTKVTKQSSVTSVLQPRDVNAQTPAASPKDGTKRAQPASTASGAGKLPPVKRGMFAQTPLGRPFGQAQKQAPVPTKMQEAAEPAVNGSNVSMKSVAKTTQAAAGKRKALKRPANAMDDADKTEDSLYDVPISSEDEDNDDYKPAKKTRKTKATQRKRVAPTSSGAGTPAATNKIARKSKAKTSKETPAGEAQAAADDADPSRSTRLKMKAESGTNAATSTTRHIANPAMTLQKRDEKSVEQVTGMTDGGQEKSVDGPRNVQSYGGYADESTRKAGMGSAATNMIKIKKEKMEGPSRPMQKSALQSRDRGASQKDAIELSDAQPSSDDESDANDATGKALDAPAPREQQDRTRYRPRTPAALQSSPPVAGDPSTKPTTAGLLDPQSTKKSTIISFDRSGPRNQGKASARPNRTTLARSDRSSLPPVAADRNFAKLSAKRQLAPSSAGKSSRSFAKEASAAPSNIAANAQDALAGFVRKSVVNTLPSLRDATAQESRREEHDDSMPASMDDGFAGIDQLDEDTTLIGDREQPLDSKTNPVRSTRTLSQVQMPPPMTKAEQERPVDRAPTVPSLMRPAAQDDGGTLDTVIQKSALGKRQNVEDSGNADARAKRVRKDPATDTAASKQSDSLDSLTETTVVPRKFLVPAQASQPVQRRASSQRQLKRQRSQGTVDIHGSPVPQGMVVGVLNTVLETFSQNAAISSDQPDAALKSVAKALDIQSSDLLSVKAAKKQPHRVASNTKALPAEPSQGSQAITHVARVPAVQRPFVTTVQTAHLPTDPFTSSEEERNVAGKEDSTSSFSEHLRRKAGQAQRRARVPAEDEEVDPDKTLVEEEPEVMRPQRPSKRIESFDSQTSSDTSDDTDDTSATLRDLGIWRTALKPHQMNLFEELVIVAHRIVRHLVTEEEARTNIIDDYRRRGEQPIQSLRADQAKSVKEYYESLKEKKKRLQRELDVASERLAEVAEEVKAVRKEVRRRDGAGKGFGGGGGELRDVMEAFC